MSAPVFIWDLDGTIFDSYDSIVKSIIETFTEFGIKLEYDYVHKYVIKYSVSKCLEAVSVKYSLDPMRVRTTYGIISTAHKFDITLIPNAKETLYQLSLKGARHFVYTHRGATTMALLDNFSIGHVFEEVVTRLNGFNRKPAPDALNYLISKYRLDKENTFYVGDRSIDMECAKNSGVKGILYLKPDGVGEASGFEDYIVTDLMDITKI